MYLINYVFGEAKIDCLNEVSKNVRVLGILTSQIADKTISIAAKMLLSLARRSVFLNIEKKCR